MKSLTAALIGLALLATLILTPNRLSAEDDSADYEATIAALETQLAGFETQVASQSNTGLTPTVAPTQVLSGDMAAMQPVSINDAFEVLYYYFIYEDGELAVYGEMQNISEFDQLAPMVRFTFLDENGNSYGDDQAEPVSHWVPAGERMPFSWFSLLGGALAPGDWSEVVVSAGDPASDFYNHDTSMLSIDGAPVTGPSGDVSGQITNHGDVSVTSVSMYVAYFDENGVYVGDCTGFSPSSDAIIPAGKSIRFEAGGGGCGNTSTAIEGRGANGPFTQRLILVRLER